MELAQNAADASSGGLLDLWYDGSVLSAANTGAALTSDGVAALASLRASAKRSGQTVGRFGVGFAAVAAVADEVVVASTSGAVRFSRELTLAAVRAIPSLAAELSVRGDRVPLLRLPFPVSQTPRAGFDTEVRLTVRPDADHRVRAMLDAVDPTLLLVLPGLSTITVQGRELSSVPDGDDVLLDGVRWRVIRGTGSLDPSLLKDRPVEERSQTTWTVTWAVPLSEGLPAPLPVGVPAVIRAPTATDDPLSTPAVLAASLPLGPDRRRVLPGPLAEAVLGHAGRLLAELVEGLPLDPSRLAFVPGPLAAGEIDATVGSAVLQAFRAAPVVGVKPADAVVLEGANPELVELLADLMPGLLPHPWSASRGAAPLRALGARRMSLAELTELLAGVDRPAAWWGRLYDALPPDVEQLGSLPVPVVGGRLAGSPRGLLVADAAVDLSALGFRVVDPEAAHDLLLRLGAQHAEPRSLLEDPRVRSLVETAADEDVWDEDGSESVVQAVLALVGAADLRPGDLPWLASLPLPTADGDVRPAGELLLPGGPLASVVDLDAGFGVVADGVAHPEVLAAVGVLRTFAVVPVEDAEDVDGLDEWLGSLLPGEEPGPVVRDLDLVRSDAWPRALTLLEAGDLLTPYTLWWLNRHPVLDGQRPDALRLKGSDPVLDGVLDVADHPLAARLGAVRSLDEVDPELLLARLADPDRVLTREQVRQLHAHLASLHDLPLPDRVRAVVEGELAVVPAEDAVVVDRPDLLARVAPYAVVPVPLALAPSLAEALDLALASELLDTPVLQGSPQPWVDAPGGYVEHERLEAPTVGGEVVRVVWVAVGSVDHVVGAEGKARALAYRLGDWSMRHTLVARFRGDTDQAESDLDPLP
ncbi:MAG: uncharacterized protein JWM02_681 [Frankiales bacterium]|nr:uncharacterized protein [Frankiales bacterium]